jgi:hypothetical protein
MWDAPLAAVVTGRGGGKRVAVVDGHTSKQVPTVFPDPGPRPKQPTFPLFIEMLPIIFHKDRIFSLSVIVQRICHPN